MEFLQEKILKQGLVSVVVASMTVFSSSGISVAAQSTTGSSNEPTILLEDHKKEETTQHVNENLEIVAIDELPLVVSETSVTEKTDDGTDGMTMLYIGGAVGLLAVGAVVLGVGGGSSSSGSQPPPTEEPLTPVVGPNINGVDWVGSLEIKDTRAQGFQNIAATVVQNGAAVQIVTSSTLEYGHMFSGRISNNGFMLIYDSITGEDWTTHYKNASANSIDLYDFVNNLRDLDRMYLGR
jgi:hypothetical protein